jgi:hypothetical protein
VAALDLLPNPAGDGWLIQTALGQRVGGLSRKDNELLACDGLRPGTFTFRAGEIRLHTIYRHLYTSDHTGRLTLYVRRYPRLSSPLPA